MDVKTVKKSNLYVLIKMDFEYNLDLHRINSH